METNQRGFEISTGEHWDATLNLSLWDTGKGNPKYFSVLTNHFMLFKHVYTQIIQLVLIDYYFLSLFYSLVPLIVVADSIRVKEEGGGKLDSC